MENLLSCFVFLTVHNFDIVSIIFLVPIITAFILFNIYLIRIEKKCRSEAKKTAQEVFIKFERKVASGGNEYVDECKILEKCSAYELKALRRMFKIKAKDGISSSHWNKLALLCKDLISIKET